MASLFTGRFSNDRGDIRLFTDEAKQQCLRRLLERDSIFVYCWFWGIAAGLALGLDAVGSRFARKLVVVAPHLEPGHVDGPDGTTKIGAM